MRDLVRQGRGMKEWNAGLELERRGIATVRCLAAGTRRAAGVLREDAIIMEAKSDATPLDRFVTEELSKLDGAEHGRALRRGAIDPRPLLERIDFDFAYIWEDMAGRKGNIQTVRAFRKNIAVFAANSAEARKAWVDTKDLDTWLIWNIWQVANKDLADLVPIKEEYQIYRDAGIALTQQGKAKEAARKFVEFVQSLEGAKIFAKWGWMAQ